MATTRLMPLHSGKGRGVAEALGRVTDYVKNPEKTNGGDLVTAYQCNPSIADQEFYHFTILQLRFLLRKIRIGKLWHNLGRALIK